MNLLRVLATVSGMTMLSRITGLAREVLTAKLLGAGIESDAYFIAFRIPNLLRRLVAEGAFSQAFVPILGEFKARRGEIETKTLVDHTATLLFWALLGITVIGMVFSPAIVWLLASGMKQRGEGFDLTVLLTRIMFPYILLISLVAAASGVLNTWRQFAVPAFTPVLLNLAFIACAIGLAPYVHPPVLALAIGVIVGGIAQLAFQVPALMRIGMLPHIRLDLRSALADAGVRRILRQMLPATLAVSVAQVSLIVNSNIASGISAGAVSWISYADRLMEFPTALLGAALGTILTPSLAAASAKGDTEQYAELLDWGMRLTFMLALPCAVALWLIALPLTATLFQRGQFDTLAVVMTQQAVTAYGVGLIGLVLVKILAPGFYAHQDIRTPVKIGIFVLVATQAMNLVFVPIYGHAGLALSIGLGACVNAALLYNGLRKRGLLKLQPGWGLFLLRLGAALLVLGGILWWSNRQFDWIALKSQPWVRIGALAAVIAGASAGYIVTLLATGMRASDFRRRV